MGNLAFFAAFVALPILSFLLVRSLTWTIAAVTGATALGGALVTFGLDHGYRWNMLSLQLVVLVALLAVFAAAVFLRGRREGWPTVPWRRQLTSVLLPVALGFVVIAVSRLAAAPRSGLFTAVGFFVKRQTAEDNAKWLDFAAQVATGNPIEQAVPLGGPLQLVMVMMATLLAVISQLSFGGINQVFVAANTVIYLEFVLVMLVPFIFAPIAEARFRIASGNKTRGFIPAPLIWIGAFVMMTASLAVSGLGHMTLEFTFLVLGIWASVFIVGSKIPHAYVLTTLSVAIASLVWFPLTVITIPIFIGMAIYLVMKSSKARSIARLPLVPIGLLALTLVLMWTSLVSVLLYMADIPTAADVPGSGGGGVRATVASLPIRGLQLLTSQGGTEIIQPALGLLAVASAVLGALYISRQRGSRTKSGQFIAFIPLLLVMAFGLSVSIFGTWFAGSGTAYGGLKSTFTASILVLAITLPMAIMQLDHKRVGMTLVRVAAIVGVIYMLTIDTILPRAITYMSPGQWPVSTGDNRGYWWPAEVRNTADQTILANPIGCAYYPQGADAPTGLPNGQTTYSCTRLLAGLSGEDSGAQQVVDWLRREWLTNTPAWTAVWPGFITMAPEVLDKQFILLDNDNKVVGFETIRTLLDRIRPEWAVGQPLLTAKP
jgi:hypothetical protein